jgi:4'-phosphopantetheinyl transferase EntD
MSTAVHEHKSNAFNLRSVGERKKVLESFVGVAVQQAKKATNLNQDFVLSVTCVENSEVSALHLENAKASYPQMSPKKIMRWVRGRRAAYAALNGLACERPPEVVQGSGGEPVWPDGICGSITHCEPWSVVVAMRSSSETSLGIDMENMARISDLEICSLVCRNSERDWVLDSNDPHARLCMIFSAKEALFKCLYPRYRCYIDFKEAELLWCADRSCFEAVLFTNGSHEQITCAVSCRRKADLIFSCSICTN